MSELAESRKEFLDNTWQALTAWEDTLAKALARADEAKKQIAFCKREIWKLENVPNWADIGDTVQTRIVPEEARTIPVPIGTIGVVDRYEEGFIMIRFRLPLVDTRGEKWLASYDHKTITIGYKPDELEPYTKPARKRSRSSH